VLLGKNGENSDALATLKAVKCSLYVALAFFCLSAAAALYHRYTSADSLSWHLQAMRRFVRGNAEDVARAEAERQARLRQFKLSQRGLQCAAASLAIGAAAFAWALGWAVAVGRP
jgi:hypothetical protein